MQHPIDTMMQTTMEQIRGMVDVNTVVGTPVTGAMGSTIIPISRVSFGFIAGGGEYTAEERRNHTPAAETFPFAGGTGAGVSVQPVGFLVMDEHTVKVLPAQTNGAMERVVELLPQLMEEVIANGEKGGAAKKTRGMRKESVRFQAEEDGSPV